jgi:hypothetical protein
MCPSLRLYYSDTLSSLQPISVLCLSKYLTGDRNSLSVLLTDSSLATTSPQAILFGRHTSGRQFLLPTTLTDDNGMLAFDISGRQRLLKRCQVGFGGLLLGDTPLQAL